MRLSKRSSASPQNRTWPTTTSVERSSGSQTLTKTVPFGLAKGKVFTGSNTANGSGNNLSRTVTSSTSMSVSGIPSIIAKDAAPHPGLPNLVHLMFCELEGSVDGGAKREGPLLFASSLLDWKVNVFNTTIRNTCYLSCVLQVLFFCPNFRDCIEDLYRRRKLDEGLPPLRRLREANDSLPSPSSNISLWDSILGRLVNVYSQIEAEGDRRRTKNELQQSGKLGFRRNSKTSIDLYPFFLSIGAISDRFSDSSKQQDVQEFLCFLLGALHDLETYHLEHEEKRGKKVSIAGDEDYEHEEDNDEDEGEDAKPVRSRSRVVPVKKAGQAAKAMPSAMTRKRKRGESEEVKEEKAPEGNSKAPTPVAPTSPSLQLRLTRSRLKLAEQQMQQKIKHEEPEQEEKIEKGEEEEEEASSIAPGVADGILLMQTFTRTKRTTITTAKRRKASQASELKKQKIPVITKEEEAEKAKPQCQSMRTRSRTRALPRPAHRQYQPVNHENEYHHDKHEQERPSARKENSESDSELRIEVVEETIERTERIILIPDEDTLEKEEPKATKRPRGKKRQSPFVMSKKRLPKRQKKETPPATPTPTKTKSAQKKQKRETESELARTMVDKMFAGTLVSSITCLSCKRVSKREEPFMDLSLTIEKGQTLLWSLDHFVAQEKLQGQNKYKCTSCNKLRDATKNLKFSGLPPVLTIHLKRFSFYDDYKRKVSHHIDCPLTLNLEQYSDELAYGATDYELFAVIMHQGSYSSCGHYATLIRHTPSVAAASEDKTLDVMESQQQASVGRGTTGRRVTRNSSETAAQVDLLSGSNTRGSTETATGKTRGGQRQVVELSEEDSKVPQTPSRSPRPHSSSSSSSASASASPSPSASARARFRGRSANSDLREGAKEWLYIDDERVSCFDREKVQSFLSPSASSNTAYILFYRQVV